MSKQNDILHGTIVWVAPFYNRSGYGVGARATVSALHRAGARIRVLSVNEVEPGIDDCDLALIKSLESTPLIPPITAIVSHVPSKAWLGIKLPEPNLRIMATTFDSSAQGNLPPADWMPVLNEMDQIWLQADNEKDAFLSAGLPPGKIQIVTWPHPWLENPLVPPPIHETSVQEKPFRFLSIAMFLPRRRWDTLIEAYLEEFKDNEIVELYLKVNYPSWHPVPGKPRQDLYDLINSLRLKTGSQAAITIDEELGTRAGILRLMDSCNVYVSTDTAATAPVSEARVRRRLVVLPDGLGLGDTFITIPVDPHVKYLLTHDMLLYQPHHKNAFMPQLHVKDVRNALRRAYNMTPDERSAMTTNAAGVRGPTDTIPALIQAINAGWQYKGIIPQTSTPEGGDTAGRSPTHSSSDDVIYIMRYAGMGDVLMSLPVARALKHIYPQQKIVFLTSRKYEVLVRANPSVDDVIPLDNFISPGKKYRKTVLDLNPAKYGLGDIHQIDAFLNEFGITVPDMFKGIVLKVPDAATAKVEKRLDTLSGGRNKKIVLLHAAKNDMNRTWPVNQWNQLAQMIAEEGHIVIATGDNASDPQRGTSRITAKGVTDWVDQLTPFEFVALCRKADLLVTTDSGTIQLAGATNIAIAGIYTIIPGRCRLPYRHGQPMWNSVAIEPECEYSGCYRQMGDERYIAPIRKKVEEGRLTIGQIFSEWCLATERYACLHRQITPKRVWEESKRLLVKDGHFSHITDAPLYSNEKVEDVKNQFETAEELFQKGAYPEAIVAYKKVIAGSRHQQPPSDDNAYLLDAYHNLAMAYASINQTEAAISTLKKALEWNDSDPALHNNLGVMCFKSNMHNDARACFEKALSIDTGYKEAQKNLKKVDKALSLHGSCKM